MPVVPLLVRDKLCPTGYEPLTIDTDTGIRRYCRMADGDMVEIITVQPVQSILDQNQNERYDAKGTFTKRGKWGALAARIPTVLYHEMRYHEDGTRLEEEEFEKRITRMLNDGDYSKFRVAEFAV